MWFLDMQSLKAAQSGPIAWTDVGPTPYGSNYNPVMALANNHIHFMDVPNVPAGDIDIFVIHCELNYGGGSYEIHSRYTCNKSPGFSHSHSNTLCQVELYQLHMVKLRRSSSLLWFNKSLPSFRMMALPHTWSMSLYVILPPISEQSPNILSKEQYHTTTCWTHVEGRQFHLFC